MTVIDYYWDVLITANADNVCMQQCYLFLPSTILFISTLDKQT